MYAASQLIPGFLTAAGAAPQVLSALSQGGLRDNTALAESLRRFDLRSASGLSAVVSQREVTLLHQLVEGKLADDNLSDVRTALARLEVAGVAVKYHCQGRPGKVAVTVTKPLEGIADLRRAYTPDVAIPVRLIHLDQRFEGSLTNVFNTVEITGDGSGILGEGPKGARAFHPVGEGKAVLMKVGTNLDAHSRPLEIDGFREIYVDKTAKPKEIDRYVEKFVEMIIAGAPGVGAFNLEDISRETCFKILRKLQERLKRFVWHDDQQGTATVVAACLLVALKLQGKFSRSAIRNLKIRVAGAGAGGIKTAELISKTLKILCPEFRREQIMMWDSRGIISTGRTDLDREKSQFAVSTDITTLDEFVEGADIFVGLTPRDTVKLKEAQVMSMGEKPIIFGLSNPVPETSEIGDDVIERKRALLYEGRAGSRHMANNNIVFPGVLAGALDIGVTVSTDDLMLAAAFEMAELPFEPVLPKVQALYDRELVPGTPSYAVPSSFDPRVHFRIAYAVARAAVRGGIAAYPFDEAGYAPWFAEMRLANGFVKPGSPSELMRSRPRVFKMTELPE